MTSEISEYLTPEEVAGILKVHYNTVYTWLATGKIKGIKIGGVWRIRKEDLPNAENQGDK
jgi:excisionase family DNA binding protein